MNSRPPVPQTGALTRLRYAPIFSADTIGWTATLTGITANFLMRPHEPWTVIRLGKRCRGTAERILCPSRQFIPKTGRKSAEATASANWLGFQGRSSMFGWDLCDDRANSGGFLPVRPHLPCRLSRGLHETARKKGRRCDAPGERSHRRPNPIVVCDNEGDLTRLHQVKEANPRSSAQASCKPANFALQTVRNRWDIFPITWAFFHDLTENTQVSPIVAAGSGSRSTRG